MKAQLIMNVGGMFSGKSTMLLQQGERHIHARRKVIFLKPELDNRYSEDEIVTHKGVGVRATPVKDGQSILEVVNVEHEIVLIDEIQFFDERIINDILTLLWMNKTVYVAGLDKDFKGEGFVVTKELMVHADVVNKCYAVCLNCGEDAGFSFLKEENHVEGNIQLGSNDKYIPLCRKCFNGR